MRAVEEIKYSSPRRQLSLNPFSALHQWAEAMRLHPLMRLKTDPNPAQYWAIYFFHAPCNKRPSNGGRPFSLTDG
jgi:hypothetical protein